MANFQIDKKTAKAIWADLQRLIKAYEPKTIDITGLVARKHGVKKTLVSNIRHGMSWNDVSGLPKREYDR